MSDSDDPEVGAESVISDGDTYSETMSVVLNDIGPETESIGDVISSSNNDEIKEDTQPSVLAPASIPDATL
eukprot:4494150-Ditylum_brightwellii.AAC.1